LQIEKIRLNQSGIMGTISGLGYYIYGTRLRMIVEHPTVL